MPDHSRLRAAVMLIEIILMDPTRSDFDNFAQVLIRRVLTLLREVIIILVFFFV